MQDINTYLPSPIEKFILSQIGYSDKLLEKYKDSLNNEQTLQEARTIIAGGIRQSGSTIACARLFDPSKDIYISSKLDAIKEFNNKLLCLGKTKNKTSLEFKYFTMNRYYNYIDSATQDKIISKLFGAVKQLTNNDRQDILTEMKSFSLDYPNSLRGKSIKSNAIFWFDLGNCMSIHRMHEISGLIKFLDKIQGDGTQKYIIL